MYLENLKIWNFRKFGVKLNHDNFQNPAIDIDFNKNLNLLVGENDSGKTAIIAASCVSNPLNKHSIFNQSLLIPVILLIWKSSSYSFIQSLLCVPTTNLIASAFLEWISLDEKEEYILKLTLNARISQKSSNSFNILYDIKAGIDDEGTILNAEARVEDLAIITNA